LLGQVALVTGASSGIGRATAIALAEAGADVALVYLTMPEGADSAAEAIRALGRRVRLFPVDITDQANVETLFDETVRDLGRLDGFVSSAVYSDRELFHKADMEGFRRTLDVSMWGSFYCLRAAANRMIAQGRGGSCVIVSSPHAHLAIPSSMAYNMAKAAQDQMARTAALELMAHQIRVNIVYPGWTDTAGERKFFREDVIQQSAANLPMGRLVRPDEVARGVLFLLDPASAMINGTTLSIDGGTQLPWWSKRSTGDF